MNATAGVYLVEADEAARAAEEGTVLTFTLTRLQRVLNPLERMAYAVAGVVVLLVPLVFLVAPDERSVRLVGLALWGLVYVGYRFTFRDAAHSLYGSLVLREYVDTIRIDGEFVSWGICGRLILRAPRQLFRVSWGWRGTSIVRFRPGRYAIVVPRAAISRDDLRRWVETGERP